MELTTIKARLLAIWRDLDTEQVWQYEELPPSQLPELKELTARVASDSELSRAVWFWLRRPRSTFYESSAALVLELLCVLLCLIIPFSYWPLTSISSVAAEMIIVLSGVAIEIGAMAHGVRLVHWRREYERSVNRLIRTIYPAV